MSGLHSFQFGGQLAKNRIDFGNTASDFHNLWQLNSDRITELSVRVFVFSKMNRVQQFDKLHVSRIFHN